MLATSILRNPAGARSPTPSDSSSRETSDSDSGTPSDSSSEYDLSVNWPPCENCLKFSETPCYSNHNTENTGPFTTPAKCTHCEENNWPCQLETGFNQAEKDYIRNSPPPKNNQNPATMSRLEKLIAKLNRVMSRNVDPKVSKAVEKTVEEFRRLNRVHQMDVQRLHRLLADEKRKFKTYFRNEYQVETVAYRG